MSRQDNLGGFSYVKSIQGQGLREVVIGRDEFQSADEKRLEWSKIATFEVTMVDEETRDRIDLTSKEGHAILQAIELKD